MRQEKEYREKLEEVLKQIKNYFETAEIRGNDVGSFIFAEKKNRAVEIYQSKDGVIAEFWENEEQKTEKELNSYEKATILVIDRVNSDYEN
jgi:hypothetical protein